MPSSSPAPEPTCSECGSDFLAATSTMAGLCPECAHRIYGSPACAHDFIDGRCSRCHWDGSASAYVEKLKSEVHHEG